MDCIRPLTVVCLSVCPSVCLSVSVSLCLCGCLCYMDTMHWAEQLPQLLCGWERVPPAGVPGDILLPRRGAALSAPLVDDIQGALCSLCSLFFLLSSLSLF